MSTIELLFPPSVRNSELSLLEMMSSHLDEDSILGAPDDLYLREIWETCRWDLKSFALQFFPHLCTKPFSRMHEDFFKRWEYLKDNRGQREAVAAPRGGAKTTVRTTIKTCHEIVYRYEPFILVLSSRYDLAIERVDEIREELEINERLLRVYGEQKGDIWNKGNFVTKNGIRCMAASRRQQIRGLIRRGLRPSKVHLDDSERSDEVLSETQREKFWTWLMGDVMKIGTTGYTNYELVGTVLHPDSALNRLLESPGWYGKRYRSILNYADQHPELWQQWRDIYLGLTESEDADELPDREDTREAARLFFEAHKEDMLAGSEVLWPEAEPYYNLMEMILVEGETAFELEKMNNPVVSERYPFNLDEAGYFTLEPDRIIRHWRNLQPIMLTELIDIALFYDPALGGHEGNPDFAAAAVVGKDRRGYFYVLDGYVSQTDNTDQQILAVAALCLKWRVPKIALETNNFQSLLVSQLREAVAALQLDVGEAWAVSWFKIVNVRNKVLRIMTLQPYIANKWLWFSKTLPRDALRMFRFFIPKPDAGKDDFPDAVEGAIRTLRGLIDKSSIP